MYGQTLAHIKILSIHYFRVSSVLNRDTKQFGKSHLFDGDEETCWNSDQVATLFYVYSLCTRPVIFKILMNFFYMYTFI